MIWQYDIRVVVMLTNLVEGGGFTCIKCNKYWPEAVGDTKRFGDIEVQLFDKAEVRIGIPCSMLHVSTPHSSRHPITSSESWMLLTEDQLPVLTV